MSLFSVYLIISVKNKKVYSYVGYTNNLKDRLFKHNNSKRVIISQYLQVSEFLLEKAQIGYLNAILDKIAKVIRKGE